MNEHYTREQVMERLGMKSVNAFLQLARKYPDAFVNANTTKDKRKSIWYDKAAVDRFVETREYYKSQNV